VLGSKGDKIMKAKVIDEIAVKENGNPIFSIFLNKGFLKEAIGIYSEVGPMNVSDYMEGYWSEFYKYDEGEK
jgi:hypothetical protein